MQGSYGPFRPNIEVEVPFWLAIAFYKRQSCRIKPPAWLATDRLQGQPLAQFAYPLLGSNPRTTTSMRGAVQAMPPDKNRHGPLRTPGSHLVPVQGYWMRKRVQQLCFSQCLSITWR